MKYILSTIIYLLSCTYILYAQNHNVNIIANFPTYKDTSVSYTYKLFYSGYQIFQSDELTMENGQFKIEAEIQAPNTLVILMGQEENILFLNSPNAGIIIFPGDSLQLSIADFGFENITFSGQSSTRFAFEKAYKATINSRVPPKPIRDAIEKVKRANIKAEIVDELICRYSKQLSQQEKQVLLANKYLDIYGLQVFNISKREYNSKDVQFITDNIIDNDRILKLITLTNKDRQKLNLGNSYHNLLKEYAYTKKSLLDNKRYVPNKSIKDDYFTLNTIYKGFEIRNYVLANFIVRSSYRNKLKDGLDECFIHYFDNMENKDPLYNNVKTAFNRLNNNLARGAAIPNFELTDSLGDGVKLHDFMGKVVILDFWFNGCGGCALITPGLEAVKKTFSERKDIQFVSVSIDRMRGSWLQGIGKFTPKDAIHLYTNGDGTETSIIKYFNINAYPTLIIIDKNGKVFNGRASRPFPNNFKAKEDLIDEINEALKY